MQQLGENTNNFIVYEKVGSDGNIHRNFVTNTNIPEEKRQVLGFLLTLKKDSQFYMIDISIENVSKETLKKMVDVFRTFCEKNNKIGLITTASSDLISQTDHIYQLKKNMENEYYGEQLV